MLSVRPPQTSGHGSPSKSTGGFAASVTAITNAFGDPTRRAIYLFVRGVDEGVTAAEVASEFDLHPNVARHHLDKLAAGSYVDVAVVRPPGGGAGRPSKRYSAAAELPMSEFPVRSDDLVLSLLGKTLALLPTDQAEIIAEHGPVMFHQSGGCCDGSSPMCYPVDGFKIGENDVKLGEIGGMPFYISGSQYEVWKHTDLIIDVVVGRGGMFSLDNGREKRFLTRSDLCAI